MPTYSVTAPNGKTLDITGDHVPTEAELHQIFAAAGVDTGAAPQGSAVGRFVNGAWKNLNPIAAIAGLADAITPQAVGNAIGIATTGPLQTAKNIGNAQLAQLSKAIEDAKSGRYSEMVGHGMASALPIVGPAAAAAGERIGSGDVAGGLGESVGLLTPFAADAAIAYGPRVARAALPAETATAIADRLEASAANRLASTMGPKVGPNKVKLTNRLADVAPDLLRNPDLGAFTKEGFAAKVADKLETATSAMDDAADARLASQQVRTAPIVRALDDQIARLTAQPVEGSQFPPTSNAPPAVTKGQQIAGITGELTPRQVATARPIGESVEPAPNTAQLATLRQIRNEVAQLGPVAPYEGVRRIREAWDKVANSKYLSSTAEDAVKSQGTATGAAKGTFALREGLASTDPASAAAYRQYSIFKSADDVLAAAQEAERARPTVGRSVMRTMGGAVAGGAASGHMSGAVVGAIVGGIVDKASSLGATKQVFVARQLQAIADALRQGNVSQAQAMAVNLNATLPSVGVSVSATMPKASGE